MTTTPQGPREADPRQLKRELASAKARGERGALMRLVTAHPAARADLIEFNAALIATGYSDDTAIAETAPIAERALGRALAAVFPASAPSLKALRQARRISLREIASRLGLGVDIVSLLEQGRIAASSVPERLVRGLGEALGAASEQISAALQGQPALAPALQRNRTAGQRKDAAPPPALTFAEAVRLSPGMTQPEKDAWLAAD